VEKSRRSGYLLSVLGLACIGLALAVFGHRGPRIFSGAAGGCCGGVWGAGLTRTGRGASGIEDARRAALAYAGRKYGGLKGITVKVNNYGCHIGVDVYRQGRLRLQLVYRGAGKVEELR
jgi:hypothetical protein